MSKESFVNTVSLSDSQRKQILDKLDEAQFVESDKNQPDEDRRVNLRYAYRKGEFPIVVEQPGGVVTRLLVSTRNLSSGGIAFLHGGFLYVGSRCSLQLSAPSIQPIVISGAIVTCRHVDGLLHEVGVKFDKSIDPHLYIRAHTDKANDGSGQNPPQMKAG